MDQNYRGNRYREDDYRPPNYNRRNPEYNRGRDYRDRNDDWGMNYRENNPNRNVYSSDRERDYWNSRNRRMNDLNAWNNRNEQRNDYDTGYRSYNRPDSSYMDTDYNSYRYGNEYYNNRYRNEGWRDTYRNEDRDWWDRTKDEVSSWFGDDDARRRHRMDEMREGEHRGKGPKNYNRSPERIKEDVSDRLTEDSLIDASNIEIDVKGNEVTLSGTVDSRYEKRRAEYLAENISGVSNVQNNLRVAEKTNLTNTGNVTTGATAGNTTASPTYTGTKNRREPATHNI